MRASKYVAMSAIGGALWILGFYMFLNVIAWVLS